jgi:predicted porin
MKYGKIISGLLLLSAGFESSANDSNHALEVGISYLEASGFNAYGTDNPINEFEGLKQNSAVPYIGYRYTNNNWRVRFGYQDYGSFKRNGISPSSDVFNQGGLNLPVLTPFTVKEDISNFNLDLTRLFPINDQWTFEAGPSINFVKQRASVINTSNQVRLLKTNRSNEQLGALVGMSYAFNDQLDLTMNYRFNKASDIDLHTFGLNLAWTF